jgi:hypothetical protein
VKKVYDNILIVDSELGIGNGGDDIGLLLNILWGYIIPAFQLIVGLFKKLFISKSRAIELIEDESNKDYDYVCNLINEFDEWPVGFISKRPFKNKSKVEKRIMKLLKYKKVKDKWIRK